MPFPIRGRLPIGYPMIDGEPQKTTVTETGLSQKTPMTERLKNVAREKGMNGSLRLPSLKFGSKAGDTSGAATTEATSTASNTAPRRAVVLPPSALITNPSLVPPRPTSTVRPKVTQQTTEVASPLSTTAPAGKIGSSSATARRITGAPSKMGFHQLQKSGEPCGICTLNNTLRGQSPATLQELAQFRKETGADESQEMDMAEVAAFQKWRIQKNPGKNLQDVDAYSSVGVSPAHIAQTLKDVEEFGVGYSVKNTNVDHHVSIIRHEGSFYIHDPRPRNRQFEKLEGDTAFNALQDFLKGYVKPSSAFEYLVPKQAS